MKKYLNYCLLLFISLSLAFITWGGIDLSRLFIEPLSFSIVYISGAVSVGIISPSEEKPHHPQLPNVCAVGNYDTFKIGYYQSATKEWLDEDNEIIPNVVGFLQLS